MKKKILEYFLFLTFAKLYFSKKKFRKKVLTSAYPYGNMGHYPSFFLIYAKWFTIVFKISSVIGFWCQND